MRSVCDLLAGCASIQLQAYVQAQTGSQMSVFILRRRVHSYGHSPWPQIIISMRRSFFGRLICKFFYEVHLKCVSHSRSNHRMLQVRQMATLECALIKGAACNPAPPCSQGVQSVGKCSEQEDNAYQAAYA